jgi:hypothetical protein
MALSPAEDAWRSLFHSYVEPVPSRRTPPRGQPRRRRRGCGASSRWPNAFWVKDGVEDYLAFDDRGH